MASFRLLLTLIGENALLVLSISFLLTIARESFKNAGQKVVIALYLSYFTIARKF
jgi:hypothetical protein